MCPLVGEGKLRKRLDRPLNNPEPTLLVGPIANYPQRLPDLPDPHAHINRRCRFPTWGVSMPMKNDVGGRLRENKVSVVSETRHGRLTEVLGGQHNGILLFGGSRPTVRIYVERASGGN